MPAMLLGLILFSGCLEIGSDANWNKETAKQYCTQPNVAEVRFCEDRYVEVVSSLPGGGTTYHFPGDPVRLLRCPIVAPQNMSPECAKRIENPSVCTKVC
ncbi:MAG: hypothetical protein HY917_05025 [Candidatus Diapherotrites archaeon]|nr:hypothetical protein [Candidatus Diapherotrites archaeon]